MEGNVETNCDGMIQTKICQLMFSMDCHRDTSSVIKGGASSSNVLTYTCGRCGHSENEKSDFDLHLGSCRSDKSALDPEPASIPSVIKINRSVTKPVGFKLSGGVIETPKVSEASSHQEKPVHVHMQVIFNSPNVSKAHSCKNCREMPPSVLWFKAHENGVKRSYICHVCQSTFFEVCELVAHNVIHEQETPYKCGVCGKCFETSEEFKSHHQGHVDQLQCYRCDKCEKTFSQELCLKKHMRMHFQSKEHRCHICEKVFPVKSKLDIHMMMHTGEKPFKCEFCDKGFTKNSLRQAHMKKKHSGNSKIVNGLEVSKAAGIKTLSQTKKVEKIVRKIRYLHSKMTVAKCHRRGRKPKNRPLLVVTPTGKRRGRPPKALSEKSSAQNSSQLNNKKMQVNIKILDKSTAKKEPGVMEKPKRKRGRPRKTVIPEPETVISEPKTVIPEPETVIPEPKTVIPEPKTVTPKPKTVIPEPKKVISEPKTVIPEPSTAAAVNSYSNRLRKNKTQIEVAKNEKPPPVIIRVSPSSKRGRKRKSEMQETIQEPKQTEQGDTRIELRKDRRESKPRMLVRISVN